MGKLHLPLGNFRPTERGERRAWEAVAGHPFDATADS